MSSPIPQNYAQWHHCITVEWGISLTSAFVSERLAVWRNAELEETVRFRERYGDAHWRSVLSWFEHAEAELSASDGPASA